MLFSLMPIISVLVIFVFTVFLFKILYLLFIKDFINKVKGYLGEKKVKSFLESYLDENIYRIFNDIMLPDDQDGTTQIDHIVVSPYGIFVIETKNWAGCFSGLKKSEYWKKHYGKRFKNVENPFRQNYKHICCLSKVTDLPEYLFFNVVAFLGSKKVLTCDKLPVEFLQDPGLLIKFIKSQREILIDNEKLDIVCAKIQHAKIENTRETRKKHNAYVQSIIDGEKYVDEVHHSNSVENVIEIPISSDCIEVPENTENDYDNTIEMPEAPVICPQCGSIMILRKVGKGKCSESVFWQCSKFPVCRCISYFQ